MPEYITVPEAAEIARAPITTIRHWLTVGKLPSYKPGRHQLLRKDQLLAFIEGTQKPTVNQSRARKAVRS